MRATSAATANNQANKRYGNAISPVRRRTIGWWS